MRDTYLTPALLRNAFLALTRILVSRASHAVFLFLVAFFRSPADVGLLTFAFFVHHAATSLASLGSGLLGIRTVASNKETREEFVSQLLSFQLTNACIVAAVAWGVAFALRSSHAEAILVALVVSTVVPDRLPFVVFASFLGRERFGHPAALTAGVSAVSIVTLALALGGGLTMTAVAGLLLGLAVLRAAVFGVAHARWVGPLRPRFRYAESMQIARTALPFLALGLLSVVHMKIDIPMIRLWLGVTAVGHYGLAATAAGAACVLVQSLGSALFPMAARTGSSGGLSRGRTLRTLGWIFALGVTAAAVLATLGPILLRAVFGSTYEATVQPLRVLSLFLPFIFVSTAGMRVIVATGHTGVAVQVLAVNCGVNIAANAVLIPRLGIAGAAWATVLSAIVSAGQTVRYLAEGRGLSATQGDGTGLPPLEGGKVA